MAKVAVYTKEESNYTYIGFMARGKLFSAGALRICGEYGISYQDSIGRFRYCNSTLARFQAIVARNFKRALECK